MARLPVENRGQIGAPLPQPRASNRGGLLEGPLDRPRVDGLAEIGAGKKEAARRIQLVQTALEQAHGLWREFYDACFATFRGTQAKRAAMVSLLDAERAFFDKYRALLERESTPDGTPVK